MANYKKAIQLLCPKNDNGLRYHGNAYYEVDPTAIEITNIINEGKGNQRSDREIADALNEAGYTMRKRKTIWLEETETHTAGYGHPRRPFTPGDVSRIYDTVCARKKLRNIT